jgi:mono/diheme cytochrome c family protein
MRIGPRVFVVAAMVLAARAPVAAQPAGTGDSKGQAIYLAACAACHGADGRGMPRDRVGFDTPLPDFTDCGYASPETAADWVAIAHDGGPTRAFDRRMPAFGAMLSEDDLALAVAHIREFCEDPAWPRGELNLPRPLVTEKAFPENEAVLDVAIGTGDSRSISQQFVYEHRIGTRTQYEVIVPFDARRDSGAWQYGLGDVAVALKSALAHSSRHGSIFTVGGEVLLPTGKEAQGLGGGATVLEPFVAFGQVLPHDAFLHAQAGIEAGITGDAAAEAFWRAAVGLTIVEGRFGRSWSPMVEVLGARELDAGTGSEWDVVPQIQISLSRRQHILVNVGVRVPIDDGAERHPEVLSYFLWDWFDGGLFDGWR